MKSREIIKRLLTTEKSTIAKETEGKYSFEVDRGANKYQIKSAVEDLFQVTVASVRTVVMPGKIKRLGRYQGKTSTWKKAIVKLGTDQQITEFENL
ncbi:MAG: 50S ribosomal protein L23 [FCB group bacterium]|nr:50S ribosomal protein L23 [FCB group bacterium]